jgi:signal transduction histidine kinase
MRWQTPATWAGLVLIWAACAVWQYRDYCHERELIQETLHQQSHSVMGALLGGIRSHRRLGQFFEVQLQGMLDELVKSDDILAVAVLSNDAQTVLSAGNTDLLGISLPIRAGDFWDPAGFRLVDAFHLAPAPCPGKCAVSGGEPGGETGEVVHCEQGGVCCHAGSAEHGPFAAGGDFAAVLLLDRGRSDALNRHAAFRHALMAAAGALLLACVVLAWRASVKLVAARGRAHVLEVEAQHLRELSQAAAGLAHETRNPLGLVRGWTQRLAQSGADDAERQEHARAVIEECDRVTARINQFLAFAKPHEPHLERVDVQSLCHELATILQPDLEARKVNLVCTVAESKKMVRADRELLRQALFNLVQNAICFSPENTEVGITAVGGRNGYSRIEVSDHGPGVPRTSIDSLFTPYFTTRPDGTGLGLAIVKRIATLHGWRAGYTPRSDGGAVFSLDDIHD